MKKKFVWLGLSFLLVAAMLLASCSTSTKTSATTKTTATTTTTTTAANWWDSLGTPKYGGTITLRDDADITNWDPYSAPGSNSVTDLYLDNLTGDDWTMNPKDFAYQADWRPPAYVTGRMAQSYEFTTPNTWVVHLRQGMHWQNVAPANGREVIASDVVASYQRMFGLGAGKGSPFYSWYTQWNQLKSLTANDNYTITFQWATSNTEFINELVNSADASNQITCPDIVKAYADSTGAVPDWHHAAGCGPFMVKDFVSGTSATFVSNPNYYAFDERYTKNRLPYVDGVTVLIIPDPATALSALRTGKIDTLYGMSNTDAANVQKSNPEIVQIPVQGTNTLAIEPRCDKAPYSDIRVRQALQMSINLPDIAASYYQGNCSPYPSSMSSMYLSGWGLGLYPTWPQELKDTYDYNVAGAKALLAQAGFTTGFNTDCVSLSTQLWDPNILQIVKADFAVIGVNMDIRQMDVAPWTSFVRQTHSEDALSYGHSQLGASFEPIFAIGMLTTNNSANIQMVSDPYIDATYARAVNATSGADFKQAVYDMNYYVAKMHYAISLTTPNTTALCQPWFKGFMGQDNSVYGGSGPRLMGFYNARFWVDQNLKKNMGY